MLLELSFKNLLWSIRGELLGQDLEGDSTLKVGCPAPDTPHPWADLFRDLAMGDGRPYHCLLRCCRDFLLASMLDPLVAKDNGLRLSKIHIRPPESFPFEYYPDPPDRVNLS